MEYKTYIKVMGLDPLIEAVWIISSFFHDNQFIIAW